MQKVFRILAIFGLVLSGCIDTVDSDELLDVGEKTYINGYLSPSDEFVTVYVSKALPAVGTPLAVFDPGSDIEKFVITDAVVTISDADENSVILPYDTETFSYRVAATEFTVQEGKAYFLKVLAEGKEFNASCNIPKKLSGISETLTERQVDADFMEVEVNIAFQDFAGEKNFYIVGAEITTVNGEQSNSSPLDFDLERFTNDALGDGIQLSAKSIIGFFGPQEEQDEKRLLMQVANVEETLYQSLRTSYLNSYNEDNPFVEYSIAPDNIVEEDGIGVFAGYQLTEKEIVFDPSENP